MKTNYGKRTSKASQCQRQERLANSLGWFSIGLGLAELVSPGSIARLIGVNEKNGTRAVLRAYGLREIGAGIGILARPRPAGWLWGRVAGDVLDLASLGSALKSEDSNRTRVAATTAAVLGVTALDVLCAQRLSRSDGAEPATTSSETRVTKTIIVNRSPEEAYEFWHDLQNLPKFMRRLESVQVLDDRRSHWKVMTPAGKAIEWDAEIVDDQPNKLIAWRSLGGSDIDISGSVRFERATGGRGTLVKVELDYTPPGGVVTAKIAKLFGADPGQQIEHNLRDFKQVMETGEIAKSDASIHPGMHAAQPPAREPEPVTA